MTKKLLMALCLVEIALMQTACFETAPQGCETKEMEDGSVILTCVDDDPVTLQGPQGIPGEQGEQGEQGESGADGVSTALRTEDASSEQCMYGGTVVYSGADDNRDGELGADEQDGSFVVCQGVPGEATAPIIVPSDASIDDCQQGGTRLDIGVDLDQSGDLDAEEIEQNFTICNGEVGPAGPASMIKVTVGGALGCDGNLIETGVDFDESGTLDGPEIDSSFEVCDGAPGRDSLLRVNEGAATSCPSGGDVLELGLDEDESGTLEASEVDASFELCHGEDGAPGMMGFVTLFRLTPEPMGANCAQGGQLIEVGIDNGDGGGTERNAILEAGEVDSSSYVCNGEKGDMGEPGKNSLVITSDELPGANCAAGGVKIEAGIDDNGNGTLEAGEIDASSTQYLCAPARPVALQASVSGTHTCALLDNGEVWCWGTNNSGQLGDGTTTNRSNPVKVQGLTGARSVALGHAHTCAVLMSGAVKCWGNNIDGQLGDGTTNQSSSPVDVTGLNNVLALGLGNAHSCARLTDGTAYCWGRNDEGQLGDGTNTTSSVPVQVQGLTNVKSIDGGFRHTCAISGGASDIHCWGFNVFGQLGNNTTTDSSLPVYTGLTAGADLSAGVAHTCAIINTGTIRCWGYNGQGQLGDGTSIDQPTPVVVPTITTAEELASGSNHTCVRLTNGQVQCWGANDEGQLGDGTDVSSLAPVTVFGIADAIGLGAGSDHNCVLLDNSYIQCWGLNNGGQLGNGTISQSTLPVFVIFQ